MIDIAEILKDCPKGTKLYSPAYGEVALAKVRDNNRISITFNKSMYTSMYTFNKFGQLSENGECLLFPSKEQRDWTKFKVKKERFDPHTLEPFDKVLVLFAGEWHSDFFSYFRDEENNCALGSLIYTRKVIPYNDDTKHLIGTTDDCPEYYKWWEK